MIWFEPLAKGYNKLPDPLKQGTVISPQILELCYQFQTMSAGNKTIGSFHLGFAINTSVGILGFKPAEKIGLKPHKEDVGKL